MINKIWSFVVFLLISLGIYFSFKQGDDYVSPPTNPSDTQVNQRQEKPPELTSVPQSLPMSMPRIDVVSPEDEPGGVFQGEIDGELWRESAMAKASLHTSNGLPADLHGEVYLEIDLAELLEMQPGSSMNLTIPQMDASFAAEVDVVQEHAEGMRTLEAYLPGYSPLYMAVITVGPEGVFGQMNLPVGAYAIQGQGQHAWLAAKADMAARHHMDDAEYLDENSHSSH